MDDFAGISIVHRPAFSSGTSQTPGSLRFAAISRETGVTSAMWGGTFLVEPGARTGIHHHGKQETIVYVLEGEARVRWGQAGEFDDMVGPGDFLRVPPWLPHQEINPSQTSPFRWVVVRSTAEPIVVNLPEDFWKLAEEAR
jgi:uncharacterized RmlC-like cupin family protein